MAKIRIGADDRKALDTFAREHGMESVAPGKWALNAPDGFYTIKRIAKMAYVLVHERRSAGDRIGMTSGSEYATDMDSFYGAVAIIRDYDVELRERD